VPRDMRSGNDGDEHYRDSMKIKADRQMDMLAAENGMRLVRVPCWVQLDQTVARHWFGLEAEEEGPVHILTLATAPWEGGRLDLQITKRALKIIERPGESHSEEDASASQCARDSTIRGVRQSGVPTLRRLETCQ
jgi:hypothetical protein